MVSEKVQLRSGQPHIASVARTKVGVDRLCTWRTWQGGCLKNDRDWVTPLDEREVGFLLLGERHAVPRSWGVRSSTSSKSR